AEDGIRDFHVTGVQTCALPILLTAINAIERQMGRVRVNKWEARLIDIDILYYGDQVVDHTSLQIPHPHLPDRRFALTPLQEIARSEERRVGKGCKSRWWREYKK